MVDEDLVCQRWLATIDHPEGRQIQDAISDVCYQAADLAVQLGDLDTARWAAELGHAVTPDSDRPLCQMLLIAKRGQPVPLGGEVLAVG